MNRTLINEFINNFFSNNFQLCFKLLTFVYETVNNSIPFCFQEFFNYNSSVHNHKTKQLHRGDIFMVQTNSSRYRLKLIRYLGAKSWALAEI